MAVAKSYEKMEIIDEPYKENGKMYVRVRGLCPRCGGSGHYSMNAMGDSTCYRCSGSGKEDKIVRWYTEAERANLDKAAERRAGIQKTKVEERRIKFAARNAFGFGDAGYITLFRGDQKTINDWAHETSPCRARFNTFFGWFAPSTLEIVNLPESITPVQLPWSLVHNPDDPEDLTMIDMAEVKKIIKNLLGEPIITSTYQGAIGEYIDRHITVIRNIETDGYYGHSRMHIMQDDDGNQYLWSTASKNLEVGSSMDMRMKVKDHREYDGIEQTIVYYCKVRA